MAELVKDDFVQKDSDATVVVPESGRPDVPVRVVIVGEKVCGLASECYGGVFTFEWEASYPVCEIGVDGECGRECGGIIAGVVQRGSEVADLCKYLEECTFRDFVGRFKSSRKSRPFDDVFGDFCSRMEAADYLPRCQWMESNGEWSRVAYNLGT